MLCTRAGTVRNSLQARAHQAADLRHPRRGQGRRLQLHRDVLQHPQAARAQQRTASGRVRKAAINLRLRGVYRSRGDSGFRRPGICNRTPARWQPGGATTFARRAARRARGASQSWQVDPGASPDRHGIQSQPLRYGQMKCVAIPSTWPRTGPAGQIASTAGRQSG